MGPREGRVNPEELADRLARRNIDLALAYLQARLRLQLTHDCRELDAFALRVAELWPAPLRPRPDRSRGSV